jgi:hypothetical protein
MANLRVAELDFDAIKNNLKTFLQNYTSADGAPYFTDFDFEGSGISILLDLLAYNTHYNAYYANMVVNEMFLDSAVKRASAISIAKHLGYTPLSVQGAKAQITFNVAAPTNSPSTLTLNQYTQFNTTINGGNFAFVNLSPMTISPKNGVYTFANVPITEGTPLQYTYTVYTPGPAEKYVIPNLNVDTTTIQVVVQNSLTDLTTTTYTLANDTVGLSGSSNVFFLEMNAQEYVQIYFGDGIIGNKLSKNNLVKINYLVSNGTLGNVSNNIIQEFTCSNSIGGGTPDTIITATINSTGGSNAETIDEIKFKAPLFSSSQNRAVSSNDYKAIIEKNFPLIESIAVWGGETNIPPMYGKVIISLKPYEGYTITTDVKSQIQNILLANKQVVSISPEFIDPEYIYVNLTTQVKFNTKITTYSATDIQNLVNTTIKNYFSNNLQKFNNNFIFSQLSRLIDGVNQSIIGNLTTVKLQKRITPIINSTTNYYNGSNIIKFRNGLVPTSFVSTRFVTTDNNGNLVEAIIQDVPNDAVSNLNGIGTLKLINADTNIILNTNYGTINYGTGDVTITNIRINGYTFTATDIRLTATVQDNYLDIQAINNTILLIDDSTYDSNVNRNQGITINVVAA